MTSRHDWFYFVDGVEGDRSAAEVKLQPGDVEWWDYRSWRGEAMSVPVVVGAYPHPFLGGTTSVTAVGVAPKRCARDRRAGARHGRREEADEELHRDQPQLPPDHVAIRASGTARCSSSAPRSRSSSPTIRRRSNAATGSRRECRARRRAARSARRRRAARLAGMGGRAHLRGAPRRRVARAGEAALAVSDRRADERRLGRCC